MKKTLFILIIFLAVFFGADLYNAQAVTIEAGIPGSDLTPGYETTTLTPVKYISYIYIFMIGLVGIAGFASLVFYGIVWMYSGISEKKAEAMEGIKNTFIGILLALSAFIILNTINPNLVTLKDPSINLKFSTDTTQYPPIKIIGDRIAGHYYFSYKDANTGPKDAPIYRYSPPYNSLVECRTGRETYLSNGIKEVNSCSGFEIAKNFFYMAYNFEGPSQKKVSGFTDLSSCVSSSATYKSSGGPNQDINPDNTYRVGCYDAAGNFYDSNLTIEPVATSAVSNWCFTATSISSGSVFPTCRTNSSGCKSARAELAARPALFTNISSCAQVE